MIEKRGKIRVKNADESRFVQEILFDMGYGWGIESIKSVHYAYYPCLYWRRRITYSDAFDGFFEDHKNKLHTLNDFKQNEMDELKITKERVLDAAGSCSTAKDVLETLFPDVFSKTVDLTHAKRGSGRNLLERTGDSNSLVWVREMGTYSWRALGLNSKYNWSIVQADGYINAVPTRKK